MQNSGLVDDSILRSAYTTMIPAMHDGSDSQSSPLLIFLSLFRFVIFCSPLRTLPASEEPLVPAVSDMHAAV